MNHLMKYKGTYRILPEIDQNTNDFVRNIDGTEDDTDLYISCQYGNKIFDYGNIDNKRIVWLTGYVPSLGRGHNIIKVIKKQKIEYDNYIETDSEIMFNFRAKDIEPIAELMKAKTSGASTSPFNKKNLPKSDIEIPEEELVRYKEITSEVPRNCMLYIGKITTTFLEDILQKKLKRGNKGFDYISDMRSLCLGKQTKEYIYIKNMWNEYLNYLKKELEKVIK